MTPAQTLPLRPGQAPDPLLEQTLAACRRLLAQNQPGQALGLLRQHLLDHPSHEPALHLLAQAHMASREFDQAMAVFHQLLDLHPADGRLLNALGLALFMAGRPQEGRRQLEQAVALYPGEGIYLANLGKLLMTQEDWLAALERLQEASPLLPPAQRGEITQLIAACRGNLGLPELPGPAPAQPGRPQVAPPLPPEFVNWTPPEEN